MNRGQADAPYRKLVTALWVLVRTAATRGQKDDLEGVADQCWQRLCEALLDESHFVLQERNGALYANGMRIRPDVQSFAATAGIIALLQDHAISDLLFMAGISRDDLVLLARCWAVADCATDLELELREKQCGGIHVAHSGIERDAPIDDEGATRVAVPPSQLGAVFTMQRFALALGRRGPLSGIRARTVLQNVLHRMLRQPDGLLPLSRIETSGAAQAEAVRACVLAVRTAEELGWNDERSLDAGVVALLGEARKGPQDLEVNELAEAAIGVAALILASEAPAAAVEHLHSFGRLPEGFGEAMETVLSSARS